MRRKLSARLQRPILCAIAFTLLIATAVTAIGAESDDVNRALIQQEVRAALQRLINEGSLDQAIERGISNYVKKQRELARENQQQRRCRGHGRGVAIVTPSGCGKNAATATVGKTVTRRGDGAYAGSNFLPID